VKRIASAVFTAVLLGSCAREEDLGSAIRSEYEKASKVQAGRRITRAVKSPERVQSFYLNPSPGNDLQDKSVEVLGWLGEGRYAILGIGAEPSSEQVKLISDLLIPRANYRVFPAGPDYRKMCEFSPRHGLRFTTEAADTVDVLVCFECAQLSLGTLDGKEHWGGDFDPMEDRLKQLFDEFLPPRGRVLGTVIAYGNVIAPPYKFSGLQADTLLLNGYPFAPLRSNEPMTAPVQLSPSERSQFEMSNQVQEDLRSRVDEVRRAMNDTGPDLTPAIVEVYRQSPHVEDVRVEHGQILVKFVFHEGYIGQMFMPLDYKPGEPRSVDDVRNEKMENFWRHVNEGGMYLFGSTYVHYVPSTRASEVLEAMDSLKGDRAGLDKAREQAFIRDILEDIEEASDIQE
jgi:hypothetical protein